MNIDNAPYDKFWHGFCKTMRRQEFPEVKIIAVSGGARIGPYQYLDAAKKLGAARTFDKPVDLKELLQAVQSVCNEYYEDPSHHSA